MSRKFLRPASDDTGEVGLRGRTMSGRFSQVVDSPSTRSACRQVISQSYSSAARKSLSPQVPFKAEGKSICLARGARPTVGRLWGQLRDKPRSTALEMVLAGSSRYQQNLVAGPC